MNRKIGWSLCIFALLMLFFGQNKPSVEKEMMEAMKIEFPSYAAGEIFDSHGGFHGDGVLQAKWVLKEEEYEEVVREVAASPHWHELSILPLEQGILLYGGTWQGTEYEYKLAEKAGIPKTEKGYYLFIDDAGYRQVEEEGCHLLARYSYNIVYALLDSEEKTLYFMKYDS